MTPAEVAMVVVWSAGLLFVAVLVLALWGDGPGRYGR